MKWQLDIIIKNIIDPKRTNLYLGPKESPEELESKKKTNNQVLSRILDTMCIDPNSIEQ